MARIKIEDLPVLEELSKEEMAELFGGSSGISGQGGGNDSGTQGNSGSQGGLVTGF